MCFPHLSMKLTSLNSVRNFHSYSRLQSFKSPIKYFSDFLLWQKKKNFGKYNVVNPGKVLLERRTVPDHIPKPSYFDTGVPLSISSSNPEKKDECAISGMRRACQLARKILDETGKEAKVGRTTDELDAAAHKLTIDADAYPSPLNYRGFPKSICTSVNNVCCHGIPDDRPLEDGDIVNIDVTVYYEGYHGDCSKTFLVGNVDDYGKKLVEVSELCLQNAIAVCRPNVPFSLIGNVTEETATNNGFSVIPAILGHGIGSYFHGPPEIWHVCRYQEEMVLMRSSRLPLSLMTCRSLPTVNKGNCVLPGNNYGGVMRPGHTFTIEPAITQGGMEIEILDDGWTAVTLDQARSSQCEHTVLITESGAEILTEARPNN